MLTDVLFWILVIGAVFCSIPFGQGLRRIPTSHSQGWQRVISAIAKLIIWFSASALWFVIAPVVLLGL